jgi:hypothetical protein
VRSHAIELGSAIRGRNSDLLESLRACHGKGAELVGPDFQNNRFASRDYCCRARLTGQQDVPSRNGPAASVQSSGAVSCWSVTPSQTASASNSVPERCRSASAKAASDLSPDHSSFPRPDAKRDIRFEERDVERNNASRPAT